MSPVGFRERLEELRASVAVMRELGVTEWGDIKLGPEPHKPAPPLSEEDEKIMRDNARLEEKQRHHSIAFGASSIRPAVRPKQI